MSALHLTPYEELTPLIYAWRVANDEVPRYRGWEKIGYTTQSADARIAQQASQMDISQEKIWERKARFQDGGVFTDKAFHRFLAQNGVEREVYRKSEKPSEWFNIGATGKKSLDFFKDFSFGDLSQVQSEGQETYVLRPEQRAAVNMALDAFTKGDGEVLWNAKPRFGKTLATYDLMQQMDAKSVLIVTNRPSIANSWFDDFERFIGHQTNYKFVSDSLSLKDRTPISRKECNSEGNSKFRESSRLVEFLSLQDLKGSRYFGGKHFKLKHIVDQTWDLLVIDEAHEGVDTTKADVAFDHIKRLHTLHLSGTPFKALAAGKFDDDDVFNWTYSDEQQAKKTWDDDAEENPYENLPTLNLLTYQLSRMLTDRLAAGVSVDDESGNLDYAFDLNEFFKTKENGFFEHEAEVIKFLDTLTTNEKYPFSTPELREENRHSFWLLNRVSSAKALAKLLNKHELFQDYEVVIAAGDGRPNADDEQLAESDPFAQGQSLNRVRRAIANAEENSRRLRSDEVASRNQAPPKTKTITLSVGQLTTGVTVPEWTAVMMLSNMASPSLYLQAAFRAQNPHQFIRGGELWQKKNAYIFDFAPQRTLQIFEAFANNLSPNPPVETAAKQANVRNLLNFFPVLGEDTEGKMVALNAEQVLTFPQVFKAKEVVRRGFMSNLLFENVAGIFRYSEHVKAILDKLPAAKEGKVDQGSTIGRPVPPVRTDDDGVAIPDETIIINTTDRLGKPVYTTADVPEFAPDTPVSVAAKKLSQAVVNVTSAKRAELATEFGMSNKQVERDQKATISEVTQKVTRAYADHGIQMAHWEAKAKEAATEAEAVEVQAEKSVLEEALKDVLTDIFTTTVETTTEKTVRRETQKKEQTRANEVMDDVRAHLRGFARTIPMFLMACGSRDVTLANFTEHTPDDVFQEVTGITEDEFKLLRDGQEVPEADGTVSKVPGMFDETVFNQSVQEFLNKKAEFADYFTTPSIDRTPSVKERATRLETTGENIFDYIPQQKTSLVFTPKLVVREMVDILKRENPGIFSDPNRTFADLFSKAGLFIMEIVKRLDAGLANVIPDREQRLHHIFTQQVFTLSPNKILQDITLEAVSGGKPELRHTLESTGHFRLGNLAKMNDDDAQALVAAMLGDKVHKFDVVIGNPPYQDDAVGGSTQAPAIYDKFMDKAYETTEIAVLVTPARFLSGAGTTPKAWNKKMLEDPHLKVASHYPYSDDIFPGTDIKGGIAITYRDTGNILGPIGTFTGHDEVAEILKKVEAKNPKSLMDIVTPVGQYKYQGLIFSEQPELMDKLSDTGRSYLRTSAFVTLSDLFFGEHPNDGKEYVQLIGIDGRQRVRKWFRRDYLNPGPDFNNWKVVLPKANNSGAFGETLANPFIVEPGVGYLETFIGIGAFDEREREREREHGLPQVPQNQVCQSYA
jgi:type II restriction enzyme